MSAQLNGKSVLVCDDDPDVVMTVQAAFSNCGARVTTAGDGNKAVEMARKVDPDLIILDMMMPRRSGFLVMETLKPKHDAGTRPYVIMITANEGKRHELYAKHLGVDGYITKPFSVERLLEQASALLGADYRLTEDA